MKNQQLYWTQIKIVILYYPQNRQVDIMEL